MSRKSNQVDDQKLTLKPMGICVRTMEKMANMRKNTAVSKAVEETKDLSPDEPEGDLSTFLKPKLLAAMRVEVHSAVGTTKRKVLPTTDE